MLIAAAIAIVSLSSAATADSVSVSIAPFSDAVQVEWVAFHGATQTEISSGTGPVTVMQASDSAPVKYCGRDRGTWLKIEVVSKRGTRISGAGPCTVVVATKTGVSTSGAPDPRRA